MMKRILYAFFNLNERKFLMACFFIAFAIRLFYVLQLEEKWYFADTAHYDLAAQHLIKGEGFGPSLHFFDDYSHYCLEPVYPLYLAALYQVFGHSFLAVRISQIFLSILHVYLLFLITRKWFSPRSARMVALFCAVYPFFIFIAGLLYVTQLFTLLLITAVWGFVQFFHKHTFRWLVFAFAFLTLAALARPIILPSIPLFLLFVLLEKNSTWLLRLKNIVVALCIIVLLLLPWSIRNYRVFGILAPGRACLAEAKILDMAYARIERPKILDQPFFQHDSFSLVVEEDDGNMQVLCFLDGKPLIRLNSKENNIFTNDSLYCGLMFKGGIKNKVNRFVAGQKFSDGLHETKIQSDSFEAEIILGDSVAVQGAALVSYGKVEDWRYKALFKRPVQANYFYIDYPDSITPRQVRNIAIWIGLEKPALSANGYMIWLHPWLEADLWIVRNGIPFESVPVEKDFLQREPATLSKIFKDYPVEFLTQHFWREFRNFWSPYVTRISTRSERPNRILQIFSFVFFLPVLLFFPVGIWFKRGEWRKLFLLLIPVICSSIGYSVYFTEIRYRIPVEGFVIILALYGIENIFLKKRRTL
jgi:4-amino-4-deoxy-L-arabinose transferase-like glycosyltransferase